MLHLMMTACFKDVVETNEVTLYISIRICYAITHTCLCCKVHNYGNLIFCKKRVGRDGKLFTCHKFRSMTVKHDGSSVSVAGDSRITPFGAKLRHYKIDELPELWDVLIGNMSFVGPRPDVPGYADKLQGDDRDVLKLRPGITGPATLKYRLEDEMISEYVAKKHAEGDKRSMQEIAIEYNDKVMYPDKVRLNCYYYRH